MHGAHAALIDINAFAKEGRFLSVDIDMATANDIVQILGNSSQTSGILGKRQERVEGLSMRVSTDQSLIPVKFSSRNDAFNISVITIESCDRFYLQLFNDDRHQ